MPAEVTDARIAAAVDGLVRDGLVVVEGDALRLPTDRAAGHLAPFLARTSLRWTAPMSFGGTTA